MARRWYLIDDDGRRELIVDPEQGRVESGVKVQFESGGWPAFTQIAIRTDVRNFVQAIRAVAREFDLPCRRISAPVEPDVHVLVVAEEGDLILAGEPGVPFEDRFVTAASSEALVDHLQTDAIHFGYDPSAQSLHLTKYVDGNPDFTWCDSLRPGPSFALTFHSDGRCTEEDPRQFAVSRLSRSDPRGSLDRAKFVRTELAKIGVDTIDPDLRETVTHPKFAVDTKTRQSPSLT